MSNCILSTVDSEFKKFPNIVSLYTVLKSGNLFISTQFENSTMGMQRLDISTVDMYTRDVRKIWSIIVVTHHFHEDFQVDYIHSVSTQWYIHVSNQ